MAEHDALTHLYNRDFFFAETHKMLLKNPDVKFTFLRLDIERFRNLNSYWGDEGGNTFLKYIASGFNGIDDHFSHVCYGRINADVFCLCAPSNELNEKNILKSIIERINIYDSKTYIKPVLGIYKVTDNMIPVEKIYARASAASRECKRVHTQNLAYFDDKMRTTEEDEAEIITDMKEALETHQFVAYYQPKYSLKTNRMYGAEALVRWQHPEKGLIAPGRFIPVFERNGFIKDLDLYMWNTVAHQIREWIDAGLEPTPISVNISRVSINNPDIVRVISEIVKKNNISPSLFNLEITESAYMDNPDIMTGIVNDFKAHGFTVMMDDFGSGYSSLNTLKNIPVDVLKIDMKFIEGDDKEGKGRIILSAVIRMAGWLGMPVIVEGVEKEYQSTFLKSMGCGYIQGYYYARPMPETEYRKIISAQTKGIVEPFEEAKVKDVAEHVWAPDPNVQQIFNSMDFPVAICSQDEGMIYPLLVNSAYNKKYGYGVNIIDSEQKNGLVKDAEQIKAIYQMFETSAKGRRVQTYSAFLPNGHKITGVVNYLFAVNNLLVYFVAVIEEEGK